MFLPGITVNTGRDQYYPIKEMQMMCFERWERFWPTIGDDRRKVIGPAA
jgi:hypothetical protein